MDIICTDFDGTIYTEFAMPPIPADFDKLITEFQKNGGIWVINTGRDITSLMESLGRSHLNIKPDWLVVVERSIFKRQGHQYVAHEPWNQRCEDAHKKLWEQAADAFVDLRKWIDTHFDATLYSDEWSPVSIIASSNTELNEIQKGIEEHMAGIPDLEFVRNDVYARFASKDFSKGTALAEISRATGKDAENIFAIGDHWNDMAMLDTAHAGMIACPANAIPAVRERVESEGGYLCDEYEGKGTVEALVHFNPEFSSILETKI